MNPDTELAKRLNDLTQRIIGCAFKVGGTLGGGYLEKVYENALAHELRKAGIEAIQQHRLEVWYDGIQVGEYIADLVIPKHGIDRSEGRSRVRLVPPSTMHQLPHDHSITDLPSL